MIKIRKGNIGDIRACAKLSKIPELRTPGGDYPPQIWFRMIVQSGQILLVAEDKGKIIGYRMGEKLSGPVGLAHLLVVKEEYQNKGIGKKLMVEFEKECKKRGIKWLISYVYAKNPKTVEFFKKQKYNKGSLVYEFNKRLK